MRGLARGWQLARRTLTVLRNEPSLAIFPGLAAVAAVVAFVALSAVGRILLPLASRLAGAAWAIGTFFVIPVLAFERLGPMAALKRSATLVRERWGEGVAGTAAIVTAAAVAGAALSAIFRVVLYRFATNGVALAGFDAAELAGAVRPTSRRRRHPV
jgi:Family of unknown function (DUF6159)